MILLDTHTFYWFIRDDEKMPAKVKELIETKEKVFVSIATFWEMTIKSSLGKLELPASISDLMNDCAEFNFTILPIGSSHLEKLINLPWIHRDPFDRILICQAQQENLTLVTVDSNIVKYDVKTFW